jgi:hypothetical protein
MKKVIINPENPNGLLVDMTAEEIAQRETDIANAEIARQAEQSGLQRLAKPSSNKFLQNTSGGVVSWETVVSKVVGIHSFTNNTRAGLASSTSSRTVMWQVGNFTKEVANSKLLINVKMPLGGAGTSYPHFATTFIRFSTSSAEANGSDIFGYIHNTRAEDKGMGGMLTGEFLYDTTGTNISGTGAHVRVFNKALTANEVSTLYNLESIQVVTNG